MHFQYEIIPKWSQMHNLQNYLDAEKSRPEHLKALINLLQTKEFVAFEFDAWVQMHTKIDTPPACLIIFFL